MIFKLNSITMRDFQTYDNSCNKSHFSQKKKKKRSLKHKFSFKKKSQVSYLMISVETKMKLLPLSHISHPSFLDWIEREQFLYRAWIWTNTIGISLGMYRETDSHACRRSQIQNFCDISYTCIMMDFFFPFFFFFSLPLLFFVFSVFRNPRNLCIIYARSFKTA